MTADSRPADWRLAVDIGGTFTDVVLLDAASGDVVVDKTLTTPSNPLEGVRRGVGQLLARAGVRPAEITAPIVHATTLITNALIEGKTGRAAMVTTSGFGDTLLIRDEHRYDMYDLQIEFPAPPIPRDRTFELAERTLATGEVQSAPTAEGLATLVAELRAAEVEAVGICFLNSYVNAANERAVAEHLRAELGVPVCISAEVSPQIREYPRMVTTACNAATMPVIGPYLDELQKWLSSEGFGGSVLMMLSNGGVVSADDAAAIPIRLVESGPAAGALAGTWFAARHQLDRLLCFDMGGTTAKACLIEHGEPELTNVFEVARAYRFKKGSGFPVSVPSVDLVEIGAGGGSLAWIDQFGLLKVGPESAGAEPGPVAYGRGGTVPAVTDADVILGMLDPQAFLGGDMPLDDEAATAAASRLGERLGLAAIETAAGIHEIVNQNMAAAARMHGVEQGVDLRGIPLLAFGGAGPVHACGVAELLESDRVIFPVNASVLSAFGTLVSPVRIDLARSMPRRLDTVDPAERDALLDGLRAEGHRVLAAAGVPAEAVRFRYGLDARYAGQGNEVTVWVGEGDQWPASDAEVVAAFEAEYRRIYGLTIPDVAVEGVTWRLSAFAAVDRVDPDPMATGAGATPMAHRPVVFSRGVAAVETPVYRRADLGAGARFDGPAVVEERETTAVIRPGWSVEVAPDGSLVATRTTATATAAATEGAPS
jgi:N-methylhydantoinase A